MKLKDRNQGEFVDFYLPFAGKLSAKNRWVVLAQMVPWEEVEGCYAPQMKRTKMGAPGTEARIAFGALLIKERLGITDEETVEQIAENPYLQFFLGQQEYKQEPLFDPSMMVHFRSRFEQEAYEGINLQIVQRATRAREQEKAARANQDQGEDQGGDDPPPNQGKLLLDASCAPADITYPTDLKLLNEAREKTEKYIDKLHAPYVGQRIKARTYRRKARARYLAVAKQKNPAKNKVRKAIGQQLRYVKRNLGHIDKLLSEEPEALERLSRYDRSCLETIRVLYTQQLTMYQEGLRSIPNRIVSISQPQVRPIVRGKAGTKVEFGAKLSISHLKGGYVFLDNLSWEAYHEGNELKAQVEAYRQRFGYYPASVHVDGIYRTRENRKYCKERGIRISGKPLGRPKQKTAANAEELKKHKDQIRQDELDRIPVEGKFGNAKRKGTLNRVMAKLPHTSCSVINIAIIVLNLDKWLRESFLRLFFHLQPSLQPIDCNLLSQSSSLIRSKPARPNLFPFAFLPS
jgi:IS5 family transposase